MLVFGLKYPLHGYLHTFLLAMAVGIALGLAMFILERFFQPVYKTLLLETNSKPRLGAFVIAGVLGTMLHVLLDSPLYTDIQPLYPFTTANPMLSAASSANVYTVSTWSGVLGITFYVGLLILHVYGKHKMAEIDQSLTEEE